jgi:hypothetical protein
VTQAPIQCIATRAVDNPAASTIAIMDFLDDSKPPWRQTPTTGTYGAHPRPPTHTGTPQTRGRESHTTGKSFFCLHSTTRSPTRMSTSRTKNPWHWLHHPEHIQQCTASSSKLTPRRNTRTLLTFSYTTHTKKPPKDALVHEEADPQTGTRTQGNLLRITKNRILHKHGKGHLHQTTTQHVCTNPTNIRGRHTLQKTPTRPIRHNDIRQSMGLNPQRVPRELHLPKRQTGDTPHWPQRSQPN